MTPQAASQALAQLGAAPGRAAVPPHHAQHVRSPTRGGSSSRRRSRALAGLQRALQSRGAPRTRSPGRCASSARARRSRRCCGRCSTSSAACYPEVQPDVQLDDRIGNWVEDRVDVGFRVGLSPAEGVIARRLFPLQLIICAAPAYLAQHGAPDTLNALAAHRCSVFRHSGHRHGAALVGEGGRRRGRARRSCPRCASTTRPLETEAVLAGHVIGLLTGVTAAPHIRAGRLVPLLTRARGRPAPASSSTTAAARRSRRGCVRSSTWR